nr:unnamed protein product [Callosobruchus chinensis]
MVSRSS